MKIKRLPLNTQGRDYVVGDIHGCFHLVHRELLRIGFNPKCDRLISVGDLVDRGPESCQVSDFLELPWVHAIRGNHEQIYIDLYSDNAITRKGSVDYLTQHQQDRGWWFALSEQERLACVDAFNQLPLVIELETPDGPVGIVHAEVCSGMVWSEFIARIDAEDVYVTYQSLWSRDRLNWGDTWGVEGIVCVFCGHTPVQHAAKLGNVYYIDTGAVFGLLDRRYGITVVDVMDRDRSMRDAEKTS